MGFIWELALPRSSTSHSPELKPAGLNWGCNDCEAHYLLFLCKTSTSLHQIQEHIELVKKKQKKKQKQWYWHSARLVRFSNPHIVWFSFIQVRVSPSSKSLCATLTSPAGHRDLTLDHLNIHYLNSVFGGRYFIPQLGWCSCALSLKEKEREPSPKLKVWPVRTLSWAGGGCAEAQAVYSQVLNNF